MTIMPSRYSDNSPDSSIPSNINKYKVNNINENDEKNTDTTITNNSAYNSNDTDATYNENHYLINKKNSNIDISNTNNIFLNHRNNTNTKFDNYNLPNQNISPNIPNFYHRSKDKYESLPHLYFNDDNFRNKEKQESFIEDSIDTYAIESKKNQIHRYGTTNNNDYDNNNILESTNTNNEDYPSTAISNNCNTKDYSLYSNNINSKTKHISETRLESKGLPDPVSIVPLSFISRNTTPAEAAAVAANLATHEYETLTNSIAVANNVSKNELNGTSYKSKLNSTDVYKDSYELEEMKQNEDIDNDCDDNDTYIRDPKALRKHIQLLKCIYFLNGISTSTWGRFGTIYYMEKKLTKTEIGIIEGVMPAVQMMFAPVWGFLSDKIHSRKPVTLATQFISSSILCMLAIPYIYKSFISILLVSLTMSIFVSTGIVDAHTLDILGKKHFKEYGRIRLWHACAWGIGAFVMGFITDFYGVDVNFIIFGTLSILTIISVALVIPKHTASEVQLIDTNVTFIDFLKCISTFKMMFFYFEMTVMGAGMSVVERLLFIYLKEDLGTSTIFCGMTVLATVIVELPLFHYGHWQLRVLGQDGMFIVGMIAYTIRVFLYTQLTPNTVNWILLVEVLHGVTIACVWNAAVEFAKMNVPKELSSTSQTFLAAILNCFGGGLGSIIGGYVMDTKGSIYLYRGAALIVSLVIFTHAFYILSCEKKIFSLFRYRNHSIVQ